MARRAKRMGDRRKGTEMRAENWSRVNWGKKGEESLHFILEEKGEHMMVLS